MEQKRDQLEHLGFELRPFHAETKLVVGGHEAFVEAFLGLRKIEVTEWKAFETRFGIKLPLNDPSFSKGTMQVQAFESAQKLINLAGAIEPKVRLANIAERAGDIIGLNELFSGATNISPITFRGDLE